MALRIKVLRAKAANSEQKEELKHKLNPARISTFDEMLYNVYATRCPKPSDYDVRKDLVRVFNEIAKELYGDSNVPAVVVFGSFSMDIFDAKSDLDLSVNFGNGSVELPREKKIQTLRKFAKKLYALQKSGHVTGVLPVISAKVPILKVVDCGTDVECDISIENWDGILKSQIINVISTIDDRFPKLSFLMKAWAKAHNINSSKDKTMNSLSIVLLAAFHMQTRNPPILPPFSALLKDGSDAKSVKRLCRNFAGYGRNNKETLAELFFSLLVKLSAVEILWPKGLCASAYEGSWVSKTWDSKVSCISIEDFTDRSQNVARAVGVSQVKTIYKCIQLSVQHLSAFMDGQIEGSRLIELLFGSSTAPAIVGTGIPHTAGVASGRGKKRRPILANSVLEKRPRPVDSLGGTSTGSWIIPPPVVDQRTRTHPPTGNWIRPLAVVEAQTWTHPTTASWIRPPVGAEHQTSTHIAGSWGQPPIGIKQHQPITGWGVPHQSPPGAWDGRVFPSVPTWETQIPQASAWNRSADVPVTSVPALNFPTVHHASSVPLLQQSLSGNNHWVPPSNHRRR
ncbi:hypothetical protein Leryth_019928 [Lithospermum erythrorhizon]|nr:hypothetical protein Leryth_019928 [Lithospermum erythrorhizon]